MSIINKEFIFIYRKMCSNKLLNYQAESLNHYQPLAFDVFYYMYKYSNYSCIYNLYIDIIHTIQSMFLCKSWIFKGEPKRKTRENHLNKKCLVFFQMNFFFF